VEWDEMVWFPNATGRLEVYVGEDVDEDEDVEAEVVLPVD